MKTTDLNNVFIELYELRAKYSKTLEENILMREKLGSLLRKSIVDTA